MADYLPANMGYAIAQELQVRGAELAFMYHWGGTSYFIGEDKVVVTWTGPDRGWFMAYYPGDDEEEDSREIIAAIKDRHEALQDMPNANQSAA